MAILSRLISDLKISKFEKIISHYSVMDPEFNVFVDGGAGLGETANQMLAACGNRVKTILAFEPNPANVEAFMASDTNLIQVIPSALGAHDGLSAFKITSTTKNFGANPYLKPGTSFVGKLVGDQDADDSCIQVPVVRLDGVLKDRNIEKVDFLKLDLQGGELNALKGMGSMVETVKLMWVEYSGQEGLFQLLADSGFTMFDTEYLFVGKPNESVSELFEISRAGRNSIGRDIFFGYRRHPWKNHEAVLNAMKLRHRLIQTDLLVVNNKYLHLFHDFLAGFFTGSDPSSGSALPNSLKGIQ